MFRRTLLNLGTAAVAASLALTAGATIASAKTLRMSTWLPPSHHLVSDTLTAWADAIEEASGGDLKIKIDPAPIAKPPAQYDVVRDGAADMAYHVVAYTPGPFEILRGSELPFVSPNGEIGSMAAYDWYERNIGFDKEFQDVKMITIMLHGPGVVHSKKPINTLADLEGVKLRVGGGGVRMSEALGATPVALPAPAAYEAIQKGVADGAMFPYESLKGFKLAELLDHHLEIPGGLYTTPFAVFMNNKTWENLSDEHKAVMTEFGGLKGAQMLGAGWDKADVAGKEFALANNGTINQLSDEELAKWAEKIAFMEAEWIKRANDAGLDGEALLADLKATVEKFSNM